MSEADGAGHQREETWPGVNNSNILDAQHGPNTTLYYSHKYHYYNSAVQ